ncbi:recombinase family protein [Caldimonas tepidiphila]|uniref:recombinase family protein n=1 Tax=Caldimonas tepidiphila TaxID=2315841 RepID=UPI000E5A43DA|nr:recombinase family protein [Caldimonas tepidiphila]
MNEQKTLNQAQADKAIRRIKTLIEEGCRYAEICETLNQEGYKTIKGCEWTVQNLKVMLYRLRHKWRSFYALSQKRAGFIVKEATA